MTSAYRQHDVYPGHPVVIALEIMDAFPSYQAAYAKTQHGWPAALSHSDVRGAGGAVYQGLELLRLVHLGESTPVEAFDFGEELWTRSRKSDFRQNLEKGTDQAQAMRETFIETIGKWAPAKAEASA